MSITIVVNNCWDCPYRDKNVGGKVPHYCRKAKYSLCDQDFPKYCPLMKSDSLTALDKPGS